MFGVIFGAAIGDAVGLATEFLSSEFANFYYGLDPLDFSRFERDAHRKRWMEGDFTDDSDQMILIMENIIASPKKVDAPAFAASLMEWAHRGYESDVYYNN